MGQCSSAPTRTQSRDSAQPPPHQSHRMTTNEREPSRDRLDVPSDEQSTGGVQGLRRRRSTAVGLRELKRQRPHTDSEDDRSASSASISSLSRSSDSRDSFETAPSQASLRSTPTADSGQSLRSSSARSVGNPLRRITDQVRSVFTRRSSASVADEADEEPFPASRFVNTAVPGTPGLLESLPSSPVAPRAPVQPVTTQRAPPVPQTAAPEIPLDHAINARHAAARDLAAQGTAFQSANNSLGADDLPESAGSSSRAGSQRLGQPSRDETTQVEMLSRVLLAAATLTAARLVGSHFGRGELYGGSNEAAAMRRRAQAEIDTRRRQREQEIELQEELQETQNEQQNDTTRQPAGLSATDNMNPLDASESVPQELTFSSFLEQLRTGRHSNELSNAMFGSPDSNFFRLFRFPEDPEGRVPILLMGIRAAERGANALGDENGDDVWEPERRRGSVSSAEHPHSSVGSAHGSAGLGFDVDALDMDHGFSDSEGSRDSHSHVHGIGSDSDDYGGDDVDPSQSNDGPIFDEVDNEDDEDEDEDEDDEAPFRPGHNHHGDSAVLLNSLMSGLAGVNPGNQPFDEDVWPRSHGHRQSARRHSEESERGRPRHQHTWVIYVIGGAYPRTHPIFFAPSLMTDNPTYEDLLIVEQLLGPVKPPVATRSDLDSAGGTFAIQPESELLSERCPVCLMDYQEEDMCRTLNCKHTFHQECVDSWLTRSHNTCPMCRTKGVPSGDTNIPEPPRYTTA